MQEGEPPTKLNAPTGAVFLSYASQDAAAAEKICEALRAAGIEVWFDQSELRGGDAWDYKIRDQIQRCRLFVPVISANTERRDEGYFRREWSLAVDRTRDMAHKRTFLLPVVIDETLERGATVPEKFHELQWTRLSGGATPPAFVDRVMQVLTPDPANTSTATAPGGSGLVSRPSGRRSALLNAALWGAGAVAAIAGAYFITGKVWLSRNAVAPARSAALSGSHSSPGADVGGGFSPPPHSVAVLPFVNMSGDRQQEYFSDGLTEEILDSLSRINELRVAARTSAFSFKGKDTDIGAVARKLNVAAVLEGSVRRSAHTVRISAQLVDAASGFHVWSQTYDRNLGDVLALQTEIATSVANALRVALLEDVKTKIELGGTVVPAAFDAYLRGNKLARTGVSDEDVQAALSAYTEAIHLDPDFAMAYIERSVELNDYARFNARGPAVAESADRALADARTAVRLAPELGVAHWALAVNLKSGAREFAQANQEYERALALAPGSARILADYSRNAAESGQAATATSAARRAVALDPLNFGTHRIAGIVFLLTRQWADAIEALRTAISLQPDYLPDYALLGEAQYAQRDFQGSRLSCEAALPNEMGQRCLAIVYKKLGRQADAEAMLQGIRISEGDHGAYDFAEIYAQWGDVPRALEWLEVAVRQRNSDLFDLRADPDLDPLRREPRFQAIVRALKFPE